MRLVALGLLVLVTSLPFAQAGTVDANVPAGTCVRITFVSTTPGAQYRLQSEDAFDAIASSSRSGTFLEGEVGTDHVGVTPDDGDHFYTACNVCEGRTIAVQVTAPGTAPGAYGGQPDPSPPIGVGPAQLADAAGCPAAPIAAPLPMLVGGVSILMGGTAMAFALLPGRLTRVAFPRLAQTERAGDRVIVPPAGGSVVATLPRRPTLVPGAPASLTAHLGSLRDVPPTARPLPQPWIQMATARPTDPGQVIPCPTDGTPLTFVAGHWYCPNPACPWNNAPP